MTNYFCSARVGFASLFNFTLRCYGSLYLSESDQEFHQLVKYLYGFIGSMPLLDLVVVQLVRSRIGGISSCFEHIDC
jgi:hypothetical protein